MARAPSSLDFSLVGPASKSSGAADRAIGFLIIAVAPTLFWSLCIRLATWGLDIALAPWTFYAVTGGIFLFLSIIWAGFALSKEPDQELAQRH
jgi:hypothetical protein